MQRWGRVLHRGCCQVHDGQYRMHSVRCQPGCVPSSLHAASIAAFRSMFSMQNQPTANRPASPPCQFGTRIGMMKKGGVPMAALEALGIGKRHEAVPYGQLLRRLPEETALLVEFWRSLPGQPDPQGDS